MGLTCKEGNKKTYSSWSERIQNLWNLRNFNRGKSGRKCTSMLSMGIHVHPPFSTNPLFEYYKQHQQATSQPWFKTHASLIDNYSIANVTLDDTASTLIFLNQEQKTRDHKRQINIANQHFIIPTFSPKTDFSTLGSIIFISHPFHRKSPTAPWFHPSW